MIVVVHHRPAVRYLESSGFSQVAPDQFDVPIDGIYKLQARLHHRADGACLTFTSQGSFGRIDRCPHWPGPYEGVCLETPAGGYDNGRDPNLDPG